MAVCVNEILTIIIKKKHVVKILWEIIGILQINKYNLFRYNNDIAR